MRWRIIKMLGRSPEGANVELVAAAGGWMFTVRKFRTPPAPMFRYQSQVFSTKKEAQAEAERLCAEKRW